VQLCSLPSQEACACSDQLQCRYPPAHPHLPPPAKSCEQSAVDLTVTAGAIPSQRQQLVQARLRPAAAELLQDVADVLPGVADSGQLAAADHGVQNRQATGTASLPANNQFFLPTAMGLSERSAVVIIDAHSAIAQEQVQRIPLPQRVRNRHSQRSLRRRLIPEAVQLLRSCCMRGRRTPDVSAGARDIAAVLVGAPLDLVKLLNQLQRARRAQVTGLNAATNFRRACAKHPARLGAPFF
jgi:hypothetical protein